MRDSSLGLLIEQKMQKRKKNLMYLYVFVVKQSKRLSDFFFLYQTCEIMQCWLR